MSASWIAYVPARLIKKLKGGKLEVVLALSAFADADDDGWVHAYPAKIAELADVNRTTVTRHLNALHEDGVIERRDRKTTRSGRKSYEYRLIFNTNPKCADMHIQTESEPIKCAPVHVESAHRALPEDQLSLSNPLPSSTTSKKDIPQADPDVQTAFEHFRKVAEKLRVSIPRDLTAARIKLIKRCFAHDADGVTGLAAWDQALRHICKQPGYRKGGDHPLTFTMFTRPGNFPRYVEAGANIRPPERRMGPREVWFQRAEAWMGRPSIWDDRWGWPPDDFRTQCPPSVREELGIECMNDPAMRKEEAA